jgi:hypothetical protein
MKIKICSICNKETYLWKSNPASCKDCWLKIKAQEQSSEPKSYNASKIKQSPAKRIKSVSTKKLSELKEYRVVRDRYLADNKVCQHPDCKNLSEDLHHAKGRVGSLLTDVRFFKALCRKCHRWVEDNPDQAKALGLSLSRLEKDDSFLA